MSSMLLEFLRTPRGIAAFVAVCAPLTGVICEMLIQRMMVWVEKRPWWPTAQGPQKAMLVNLGYPEALLGEFELRANYAYLVTVCGNHALAGLLALPVAIYGWTEAGVFLQTLFVIGVLMDLSFDIYDEFRMIVNAFAYESLGIRLFGVGPMPTQWFFIIGVLHHPLAMIMACPMVLYYASLPAVHMLAPALLLAAGLTGLLTSYKFTLDITQTGHLYQFKAIVLVHLVTILLSRGYIWFPQAISTLGAFHANKHMWLFYGGCFLVLLFSLLNMLLIFDSVSAAVKWLPYRHEVEREAENQQLVSSNVGCCDLVKDKVCEPARKDNGNKRRRNKRRRNPAH